MTPKTVTEPLTIAQSCRIADTLAAHARSCKRAPSECKACIEATAFYDSLPLATLAVVTSDRPTCK